MIADSTSSRIRILVVEDEIIVACELRARLEAFGYHVVGMADSGREALSIAAQVSPDLVLIDIQLRGDVDGITVAEHLRNANQTAVIFLTAHSNEEMLRRAKATEPFAYLLKPYDETELKIAIEVALVKRKAEREREALTRQLEHTLSEVKTLRGLIPICAWCHKLRTDDGFWLSVDAYLRANTAAACTHSICPECYQNQLAEPTSPSAPGEADPGPAERHSGVLPPVAPKTSPVT